MKRLAFVLAALALGCSGTSQPSDAAGADAADAAPAPDVTAADVPGTDAGPIDCGVFTCTSGQICLAAGGGAGISYSCVDLPASCGGVATCGCLTSVCTQDTHHTCSVSDRNVDCACTDCP